MQKFRVSNRYFILGIASIVLGTTMISITGDAIVLPVIVIGIVAVICDLFIKLFTFYIIDDDGITKKTPMKTEHLIFWKEVKTIALLINTKKSIGILSSNNRFIVNPMIKNYDEFIKIAIEKCKNNPNIYIESALFHENIKC